MGASTGLEEVLTEVSSAADPAARLLDVPSGELRSVAAFPGAFNPPTGAHHALAGAAGARGFDAVFFSLGTITLDKAAGGIPLAGRLGLLRALAAGLPRTGVAVHNQGLYSGMAEALRAAMPSVKDLVFVIGMDKAPQLFDARYYDDPEASLSELFSRARFLVAPRDRQSRRDFDALLERPEARRWADRFDWLDLADRWHDHSATRVRAGDPEAIAALPEAVADYVRRNRPFNSG